MEAAPSRITSNNDKVIKTATPLCISYAPSKGRNCSPPWTARMGGTRTQSRGGCMMLRRGAMAAALAIMGGLLAGPAMAQEVLEKRVFEAGAYQTRGGATIPNVRVGYQTMGRLNEA